MEETTSLDPPKAAVDALTRYATNSQCSRNAGRGAPDVWVFQDGFLEGWDLVHSPNREEAEKAFQEKEQCWQKPRGWPRFVRVPGLGEGRASAGRKEDTGGTAS